MKIPTHDMRRHQDKIFKELDKPTHGGTREGAGRPPVKAKDRKVKIWFSVKKSKEALCRHLVGRLVEKLNA